ncbi:hypothetical protein B0O99DRAFT_117596 [Bisporella sp. PMI_857]|nr:hypothetical protein B0O99DRAFT_117596 [Bisporella sp. PMI_857]
MSSFPKTFSGVRISITTSASVPNAYLVSQTPHPEDTRPSLSLPPSAVPISCSYGPLTCSEAVYRSSPSFTVEVSVLGIALGSFNGRLMDGLAVDVRLDAVKGSVRFKGRGEEVWLVMDLVVKDGFEEAGRRIDAERRVDVGGETGESKELGVESKYSGIRHKSVAF